MPAENFVPNWAPQCLNSKGLNGKPVFHLTTSGLAEWRERGEVSWQSGPWPAAAPRAVGFCLRVAELGPERSHRVVMESGEVGLKRWLS